VQYSHDRLVIVKGLPEKYGAFLTDNGRLFHARAEATGKARSPSVERLVDGTTSKSNEMQQFTQYVRHLIVQLL